MISCVCTGILLWKEDRKVIQVFGPLTPHTKEKLGMVELEDLGEEAAQMDSFNRLFILEMEEDAGHSSPMINIMARKPALFQRKGEGGAHMHHSRWC